MCRLMGFLTALFITASTFAAPFEIGPVTLKGDAEHYGALFDKNVPLYFHLSGELMSGLLKADYTVNGNVTYAAGSLIGFFPNGAVASGVLKQQTRFGQFEFAAGREVRFQKNGVVAAGRAVNPAHENLVYTGLADLSLNREGVIEQFQTAQGGRFQLLGRELQRTAGLGFDQNNRKYHLISGVTGGNDTLIGVFITYRPNGTGNNLAVPVVVPRSTSFELPESNNKPYETWSVISAPGQYILNDWSFGVNPTLLIKNMQLVGVRLSQAVKIGGQDFQTNEVVYFDGAGRISPRQ